MICTLFAAVMKFVLLAFVAVACTSAHAGYKHQTNNQAPHANNYQAPVANNYQGPVANSYQAPVANSYQAPVHRPQYNGELI